MDKAETKGNGRRVREKEKRNQGTMVDANEDGELIKELIKFVNYRKQKQTLDHFGNQITQNCTTPSSDQLTR